uniref:J domain-containing protein n=1 Tax=Kalanchoe fedtschenkoi TaxID=63787 RepID=A0A7N0ZYC8_KALFE
MANWEGGGGGGGGVKKESDFYSVLGLKKECTETELRSAYKKLALRWHPDRCAAGGNSKFVEEAKKKFQDIQEAYSVLSDSSKRLLYDVGLYNKEDDDENVHGMGDFLNEMAVLMQQNKPDGGDSFESLQDLFNEMFQADMAAFSSSTTTHNSIKQTSSNASRTFTFSSSTTHNSNKQTSLNTSCSFTFGSYCETSNANNKRNSNDASFGPSGFDPLFQNFFVGVGGGSSQLDHRSKRRNSRQTRH